MSLQQSLEPLAGTTVSIFSGLSSAYFIAVSIGEVEIPFPMTVGAIITATIVTFWFGAMLTKINAKLDGFGKRIDTLEEIHVDEQEEKIQEQKKRIETLEHKRDELREVISDKAATQRIH